YARGHLVTSDEEPRFGEAGIRRHDVLQMPAPRWSAEANAVPDDRDLEIEERFGGLVERATAEAARGRGAQVVVQHAVGVGRPEPPLVQPVPPVRARRLEV